MDRQLVKIKKLTPQGCLSIEDLVAVEAVFKVLINDEPAWTVNCTPEHLEELLLGGLFTRGYIQNAGQVHRMTVNEAEKKISVEVSTGENRSLVNIQGTQKEELQEEEIFYMADEIFEKSDSLFRKTGCAHCCAWVKKDKIVCIFEDIGRHNALDKVIGYALKEQIPLEQGTLYTSGRVSGEYLQKAVCAGVRTVVSRAAVTSQAVEIADRYGIKLYGFVRKGSCNIYQDRGLSPVRDGE